MRKFLLFIFLFSFLFAAAQDTLKMVNGNMLTNKKYGSYNISKNNNLQNSDVSEDTIVGYVNPVGNNFVFAVNSKQQTYVTVEIFSILGQRSMIKRFNTGKGLSKFSMDVSTLPRGMYIVRFTDKNGRISLTRKLLKK